MWGTSRGFPRCRERDVGYIGGLSHVQGARCGAHRGHSHMQGARCGAHRGLSHVQGARCGVHRGLFHVQGARCGAHGRTDTRQGTQQPRCGTSACLVDTFRLEARSSPAVGLLRALWTHFASAPFSAPVADFRGGSCHSLPDSYDRPESGSGRCRECGVCGGSGA